MRQLNQISLSSRLKKFSCKEGSPQSCYCRTTLKGRRLQQKGRTAWEHVGDFENLGTKWKHRCPTQPPSRRRNCGRETWVLRMEGNMDIHRILSCSWVQRTSVSRERVVYGRLARRSKSWSPESRWLAPLRPGTGFYLS